MEHKIRFRVGEIRRRWNELNNRGASIVLVLICLTAIMVSGALAVDLSAKERRAQQLQDTADAASMSAAKVWATTGDQTQARTEAERVAKLNNLPDSVKTDLGSKLHISYPDSASAKVVISDDSSGVFFGKIVGYDPSVARSATGRYSVCEGDDCDTGLLKPLEAQNLFPESEWGSAGSDFTWPDTGLDQFHNDFFDFQSINSTNETNQALIAKYGDNLYSLTHHRKGSFSCFNTVRQGPCWEKIDVWHHGWQPLSDRDGAHTSFAPKIERLPGTTKFYFLTQAVSGQTYLRCFDVATSDAWIPQDPRETMLHTGLTTFEPKTVSHGRPKGSCGKVTIEHSADYVDFRRRAAGHELSALGFTERAGGIFNYNGKIFVVATTHNTAQCGTVHFGRLRDCNASHFNRLLCYEENLDSCGSWPIGKDVVINSRNYGDTDALNKDEVDKLIHNSAYVTPLVHNNKLYYTTHMIDTIHGADLWYLGCFDLSSKSECSGFRTSLLHNRTINGTNHAEQIHQGRLFFYRDSSGTPTGVCSTAVNDGSRSGEVKCRDLNGYDNSTAQSRLETAGWVTEQPGVSYQYLGSGFHYYHPGSNRIHGAFPSTGNTTLCFDFNTGRRCTKYIAAASGPRNAAPKPTPVPTGSGGSAPSPTPFPMTAPSPPHTFTMSMRTESYSKTHDSRCIFTTGNVGVVWGMEPNGMFGCPYAGSLIRIDPDGGKWPVSFFDFSVGPNTPYKRIRWRLDKPDGTLVASSHPDMATNPDLDPAADPQDWNAATPNLGWVTPTSELDMTTVNVGLSATDPASDTDFLVLRVDIEVRRKSDGRLPVEIWDAGHGPRLSRGQSAVALID